MVLKHGIVIKLKIFRRVILLQVMAIGDNHQTCSIIAESAIEGLVPFGPMLLPFEERSSFRH